MKGSSPEVEDLPHAGIGMDELMVIADVQEVKEGISRVMEEATGRRAREVSMGLLTGDAGKRHVEGDCGVRGLRQMQRLVISVRLECIARGPW